MVVHEAAAGLYRLSALIPDTFFSEPLSPHKRRWDCQRVSPGGETGGGKFTLTL
jgi:hypothetical protein